MGGAENQGVFRCPVSTMPERNRWLADSNPISLIVETLRAGFLGAGEASWLRLGYSFGFMLVVFVIGIVIFLTRLKRPSSIQNNLDKKYS